MSDYHPPLAGGRARTDWSGQWIWHSRESQARNAYAMFRSTFRTATAETLRTASTPSTWTGGGAGADRRGRTWGTRPSICWTCPYPRVATAWPCWSTTSVK